MGRIIFKIPESRHPFVGLGEGIIIAENRKVEPKITVTFPSHSIEITTMTGEQAKIFISQMNSDNVWNEDRVEYAKGKACEILSISYIQLHTKSKDRKAAFGRWLVWEYAKNLKMNFNECGRIFDMKHSTVHVALKKLEEKKEKSLKYMTGWEKSAYVLFQQEMRNYSQIFET